VRLHRQVYLPPCKRYETGNTYGGAPVHPLGRTRRIIGSSQGDGFLRFLSLSLAIAIIASSGLNAQNPANLPAQLGPTLTAAPFSVSEKFDYRIVQTFGLRGFAGSLIGAGIGQARDAPHEWGQGFSGFATRYASGFGGNLGRQAINFALESALRGDPRYFPSEEKGFKARMKNVLLQTIVTRTDSGGERFAYARIASAFADGQLVRAWQPASTGSTTDGVVRGFIGLGSDFGYNLLQEFIPFVRPRSLRKH
jgi:hypothetical protein